MSPACASRSLSQTPSYVVVMPLLVVDTLARGSFPNSVLVTRRGFGTAPVTLSTTDAGCAATTQGKQEITKQRTAKIEARVRTGRGQMGCLKQQALKYALIAGSAATNGHRIVSRDEHPRIRPRGESIPDNVRALQRQRVA